MTCGTTDCAKPATHIVHWPAMPLRCCTPCADRVRRVGAELLGITVRATVLTERDESERPTG